MPKKLLIIGGASLVGNTIIDYAKDDYELFATEHNIPINNPKVSSVKLDLLDGGKKIIDYIKKIKPSVVIHTVAFPNVDFCELNPKLTDSLHVKITKEISEICSTVNSKLIYFSTDAVFDGNKSGKYVELDTPNPMSYYGKTKLEAEKIILQNRNNLILRTTVIYGWHTRSRFTNWVLDSLKNKKIVTAFTDQFNTPTLVDDLVQVILKIIDKNISGLYHATGKTCLNRYQFAILLAEKFSYDISLIRSVTKLEKKQNAPRPISTCLDSTKLENVLNFSFSDISAGIDFIFNKSKIN
jgi:dTDP-4-dehydrorhamnose reductase